jgi:hypothetical protein
VFKLGEAALESDMDCRAAADEGARTAADAGRLARCGSGLGEARVGSEAEVVI